MKKSMEAKTATHVYALKEWCARTLQHRAICNETLFFQTGLGAAFNFLAPLPGSENDPSLVLGTSIMGDVSRLTLKQLGGASGKLADKISQAEC
ncbi:hypothetical protein PIB30_052958 [Stylosanthes scabra]|uniref:Uncharacterized protein n=1 Tax=Stylosanthes scabra TaxID=79078 RepID=A0ABU6RIC5_9FABA|nr:hypothetical protein [Stylosanthes scabra]